MALTIQEYIDAVDDQSCCFRRIIIKNLNTLDENDLTKFMRTSTFRGVDLVDGFSYSLDVDTGVSTANIELGAQGRDASDQKIDLSPLRNPASILQPDAITEIRIEFFLEVSGTTNDWQIEWQGFIDDVVHNRNGYNITLKCRDTMRPLVDKFIHRPEVDRVYGSLGGIAAETVMNQILSDEGLASIVVPTLPSFAITEYRQEKQSVHQALQAIADNFAWIIRSWPDPLDNNMWKPTLIDPDRTNLVPDYTITEDIIKSVNNASISSRNIRNSITVNALRRGATINDNNQVIVASGIDAASIAKYGEKHMEIYLDKNSFIDTVPEASDLVTAMLSDLANPKASFIIETNCPIPLMLLNNLVTVKSSIFFDSDQDMAIVSLTQGPKSTKISFRGGARVGMTRGWIDYRRLEKGRDPTNDDVYREPPTIGSASGGGGGGAAFTLTTGLADDNTAWIKGVWNVPSWNSADSFQMRIRIQGDPDAEYQISPEIQETFHKFLELASGAEYCGSVRAKSRSQVWSPWSAPEKCITTPVDTTAPAAPVGLSCETVDTGISVTWDFPPEVDYLMTKVYVTEVPPSPPPPTPTTGGALAWEGRAPALLTSGGGVPLKAGFNYWISATHVDYSGNESAFSGIVTCKTGRYTKDEEPPAAPTGVVCSTVNTGIAVAWDTPPEIDYDYSIVSINQSPIPPPIPPDPPVIPTGGNSAYEGRSPAILNRDGGSSLNPEEDYNISVVHVDLSGNMSPSSAGTTCQAGRFAGVEIFIPGAVELKIPSTPLGTGAVSVVAAVLTGAKSGDVIYYGITGQGVVNPPTPANQIRTINTITTVNAGTTDDSGVIYFTIDTQVADPAHGFYVHGLFEATIDDPTIDFTAALGSNTYTGIVREVKLVTFVVNTRP